jgi:segregation and condensation protein B
MTDKIDPFDSKRNVILAVQPDPVASGPVATSLADQATRQASLADQATRQATLADQATRQASQPLKFILEAAILAAHHPLSLEQLSELFDESARPTHTELAQTLEQLSADCNDRGVELVEVASGFRYQIKTAVYPHVAKLWTERQSKYSRALLETLSLIAYRQPITRAEIEAVRGVAVSSHIVRTLEEREWIRVVGHREVPGRPALFGTTRGFLDYFKLKSLEELPTLSEIKDLDDMAPELDFAPIQQGVSPQEPVWTPNSDRESPLADTAIVSPQAGTPDASPEPEPEIDTLEISLDARLRPAIASSDIETKAQAHPDTKPDTRRDSHIDKPSNQT